MKTAYDSKADTLYYCDTAAPLDYELAGRIIILTPKQDSTFCPIPLRENQRAMRHGVIASAYLGDTYLGLGEADFRNMTVSISQYKTKMAKMFKSPEIKITLRFSGVHLSDNGFELSITEQLNIIQS